jgi:hypothetical protein
MTTANTNSSSSATLENPALDHEAAAKLEAAKATPPAQGELPNVPMPTLEDIAKAKAAEDAKIAATKAAGLVRFQSTFSLQGEVIGTCIKRTASKKGAVTLGLLPINAKDGPSLASVSGLKGEQLKAFARMRGDELKTEQCVAVSRLAGDLNWTGSKVRQSSNGNEVTFVFKKVEPVSVTVGKVKELTDAEILERASKILAAKAEAAAKEEKAAKEAQALADAEELKRMEAEEKEAHENGQSNGEVEEVTLPE